VAGIGEQAPGVIDTRGVGTEGPEASVCVCVYVWVNVCEYLCMEMPPIYTYTHTHTHTHTLTILPKPSGGPPPVRPAHATRPLS
jgi:hypothetical protein